MTAHPTRAHPALQQAVVEVVEQRVLLAGTTGITVDKAVVTEGPSGSSQVVTVTVKQSSTTPGKIGLAIASSSTANRYSFSLPSVKVPFPEDHKLVFKDLYVVDFDLGQNTRTAQLTILGDNEDEPNETIKLVLVPIPTIIPTPIGPVAGPPTNGLDDNFKVASVQVTDDDGPPLTLKPGPTVTEENPTGQQQVAWFTVERGGDASEPSWVDYTTLSGTATAGADFVNTKGTLYFAPKVKAMQIGVPIIDDPLSENPETFGLSLFNPKNAQLVVAKSTATILDADPANLSVNAVSKVETNEGLTQFAFTVTRSGPRLNVTTLVDYYTENGTASEGTDFVGVDGQLTFLPGQTQRTVVVRVMGDKTPEPNETFWLRLASPFNANVLKDGLGTIVNDETPAPPATQPANSAVVIKNYKGLGFDALSILGSAADDKIDVSLNANGKTEVRINDSLKGAFSGLTNIVAYGGAGNDKINAESVKVKTMLFGEAGNDTVKGGIADDVLVGGAGKDQLFGALGRDVLLGSEDADRLDDQGGEGLLVSGKLKNEADLGAIKQIRDLWTRTDLSYDQRVNDLTKPTQPGGKPLMSLTEMTKCSIIDSLSGGTGRDFYFVDSTDAAYGLTSDEKKLVVSI